MDTFVDSSWYYLRYLSPDLKDKIFDEELIKKWYPVNLYIGGSEHSTGHLIYARFFALFLQDIGLIPKKEPFSKLIHQGLILKDGNKMSKRYGNVVNPDDMVVIYGRDVLRMYLMFMGDFQEGGDWSDKGIQGMARFYKRLFKLLDNFSEWNGYTDENDKKLENILHRTIKAVEEDILRFSFNTAISRIMELVNSLYLVWNELGNKPEYPVVFKNAISTLPYLIAPFAPCLAEEFFHRIKKFNGEDFEDISIFQTKFPDYDPAALEVDEFSIAIMVDGRVRAEIHVPSFLSKEEIEKIAFENENVKRHIEGKQVKRIIYIKNKILNIVT